MRNRSVVRVAHVRVASVRAAHVRVAHLSVPVVHVRPIVGVVTDVGVDNDVYVVVRERERDSGLWQTHRLSSPFTEVSAESVVVSSSGVCLTRVLQPG